MDRAGAVKLIEVAAPDVARAFDRFLDLAAREPVIVRRADGERVVMLPTEDYERLISGTPAIRIVCGDCGSLNVSRDAWADWDVARQAWVLGTVFDAGHCHRCEGGARLAEVAVVEGDAPANGEDMAADG